MPQRGRFEALLYSAFRDVLWARYLKVRPHPDLREMAPQVVGAFLFAML